MAKQFKPGAPAGSNKMQEEAYNKASSDPSEASSEANLSTTFGIPNE